MSTMEITTSLVVALPTPSRGFAGESFIAGDHHDDGRKKKDLVMPCAHSLPADFPDFIH